MFRLDPNGRASIGAEEDGDPTNDTVSEKEGGGTGFNYGNPNVISFTAGSGTYTSGSGASPASDSGAYHYGVDRTIGSHSSIYSGGTWGNGYSTYSYYTHPNTSYTNQTDNNPLANIKYTNKVIQQMQLGDDHGFPLIVDNYGSSGELSIIQNRYGVDHYRLTIDGAYNGHSGYFEYIWNMSGICNHRFFVRR